VNPVVPGTGVLLVKLALSLGLVVGLILLLQKAARKWGHAMGAGGGTEAIRLLSQRSVGPRLSLAVVEVRGRTLLVGISPQGIQAVADLDASSSPGAASRIRVREEDRVEPKPAPESSYTPVFQLAERDSDPAADAGPRAVPDAHSSGAGTKRPFWERWGFHRQGAAAFAAVPVRSTGPGAPRLRRGSAPPAVFEDELLARLASLRERYPSLADLESDAAEAWR
jgi:flagellar biogenesis protein FliO